MQSNNSFSELDDQLLEEIKEKTYKGSISLVDCNLTNEAVAKLVEALKENNEITELDLSINLISDEGAEKLASVKTIKSLNVSANSISSKGAKYLSTLPLKKLDISRNFIEDDGVKALAQSNTIEHLAIGKNLFTTESIEHFENNSILKTLDLTFSDKSVGDKGAQYISKNKSLTEIYLTECNIGDDGAIALSHHPKLQKVILLMNEITSKGEKALRGNKHITELDLNVNPCNSEGTNPEQSEEKKPFKKKEETPSQQYKNGDNKKNVKTKSPDSTQSKEKTYLSGNGHGIFNNNTSTDQDILQSNKKLKARDS